MASNVTKAVVKALITHLKAKCPSIQEIYEGFPNPSQKLKYPSGSIFIGEPRFTPLGDKYKVGTSEEMNEDGSYTVQRVIGDYEFRFQLDLWCEQKPQRHNLFTEFFNGFNSDEVSGKSLNLGADYFNQWAHYTIDDFSFPDTEEQSQRNEWRVKVDILVDCKAVIESNEFIIETFENNLEMPEVVAPTQDDSESVSIE